MSNEVIRDLLVSGDLGLQVFNPPAYRVVEKLDRLASSRELSDKAGYAVASLSIVARLFGTLQTIGDDTETKH
jgi:hypothetical protein